MGICGSTPALPPNPEKIDLSHFDVLKVVGKGGFGKVNAIQRKSSNEFFALKRMAKAEVIKKESHIKMVWIERNILAKLKSPFTCVLEHCFTSESELFFVMPFMQGGDLRYHLTERGYFTETETRFLAAEMVLGLEAMHKAHIVYRDLKPENVLLDVHGHLRLSDFGLAVELDTKKDGMTRGSSGTKGYLAPEIVHGHRYGTSVDVFCFGITLYEFLHGRKPYSQWKPGKDSDKIKYRDDIHPDTISFIKSCLIEDPTKRMACGPRGWDEAKEHPFFKGIDWRLVSNKSYDPPIKPNPDQANCSNGADLADQLIDTKPEPIEPEHEKHFDGFEYNCNIAEMDIRKKVRYGLVDPKTLTLEQIKQVREERNNVATGDAPRLSVLITGGKGTNIPFPSLSANDGSSSSSSGNNNNNNNNNDGMRPQLKIDYDDEDDKSVSVVMHPPDSDEDIKK